MPLTTLLYNNIENFTEMPDDWGFCYLIFSIKKVGSVGNYKKYQDTDQMFLYMILLQLHSFYSQPRTRQLSQESFSYFPNHNPSFTGFWYKKMGSCHFMTPFLTEGNDSCYLSHCYST
jgi:hypothetical protein